MAEAEPANAAAASVANDEDDADDLYADLDEQVAAALAAAGESGGSNARDSDPATDGEGDVPDAYANEAIDLGDGTADYSSSDEESDDGLHIVLNEDAGAPPPPPAARSEGYTAEDEDGEDSGNRVIGPSVNDGSLGKCKGFLERTTVPIIGQGDGGHQQVFQSDFNFFLPRNSTIFDINIEAFKLKPWRQHGVDLTNYFNFGLDEQSWREYWLSMKQVRQGTRSLATVSSGLENKSCKVESVKIMPKVANYSGCEARNGPSKPKGRAIRVEDSVCERVPSADMWRPIQRDSDVVIEVNRIHSPSTHSTSDDISALNHRHSTTKRISIDNHDDRHLKNSTFVVDNELCDRGSSEYTGDKLSRRDSSRANDQSSSPVYSDMLSGESKKDLYFKRANRLSDSTDFYEDTKLDEHTKSNRYCHSSESDHGDSENGYLGRSYTPSPVNHKRQKTAKLLWRDEGDSFAGKGRFSELFINRKSDRRLPKSGHKSRKEQKRQPLAPGSRAVFDEHRQSTDNYHRRSVRKYEQKISSSTSQRNNSRNAVHGELYGKQDYTRLKRATLRNDEHYLNNGSNDHHQRSSWRKCSEEEVAEGFSSAKEWQRHWDDRYDSMLEAQISNDNDGHLYRERCYEEETRVRHGRNGDDEFLYYSDYRFRRLHSPDVRGRHGNRGIYAKSTDENSKHHDHLAFYPQANLNDSQDWPSAGLTSMSSRNSCIGYKRINNAKMVRYHYDANRFHQHKKHHDSSFLADSIPQSALYGDAATETGRCILPVKRKRRTDLEFMNHKDIPDLALPKGRRFMHGQTILSDRKIYAVKLHNSSKEFDAEAIFCSNDMTKSTSVSNIGVETRWELGKGNNILLNDRKKFKRKGNQLIREVENDIEGHFNVNDDLHGTRHKDILLNMRGQNRDYGHSGNQNWEKSAYQMQKNEEDTEIEEGELIEQDVVSKGKLRKRKKSALKSMINVTMEDAACKDRATIECDDKRILEAMAKMQKRRDRFKEATTLHNGSNGENKETLAAVCSTDDISNQRPARKRLWGAGC